MNPYAFGRSVIVATMVAGVLILGASRSHVEAEQLDITDGAVDEQANELRGALIPTGSMTVSRADATATLLNDGRVLIAGGSQFSSGDQLSSAEIYDPETGEFTPTGSMNIARWGHSAVLLEDGKVLIVGGWVSSFVVSTNTAEIYDPETGVFTLLADVMSSARGDFPGLVRTSDGKALVLGGTFEGSFGTATSTIDSFDPLTEAFEHVADMVYSRKFHGTCVLEDDVGNEMILSAGGRYSCCNDAENELREESAELYDVETNVSFLTTDMLSVRRGTPVAITLDDGRCLVTGGDKSVEIYDPTTDSFQLVAVHGVGEQRLRAVRLADGRVLLSGNGLAIFDPATDKVIALGDIEFTGGNHTATLLNDGRVLIAGGIITDVEFTNEAWLFVPDGELIPLGGWLAGLQGLFAVCHDATAGETTPVPLTGGVVWDCEAAGLAPNRGDVILMHALGVADGSTPVGGTVTGSGAFLARCRNRTTAEEVLISLAGKTWECTAAGLTVDAGDVIEMSVLGLAQ